MTELKPCPGCGTEPADIGQFGQHQFVCDQLLRMTTRRTDKCISTLDCHVPTTIAAAIWMWNNLVDRSNSQDCALTKRP